MWGNRIDFVTGAPATGNLDVRWIHGAARGHSSGAPPIQVHAYDAHTFVMRQSKAVHAEAPFLYLLCGNDRALLLDTGATADPAAFPLRETVDRILDEWLRQHPRDAYALVVAHTHAHSDHVQGDVQFAGRRDTTVVGTDLAAVQGFFGFTAWPEQLVPFDLGGRVLQVTGSPGHHETSIAVHDTWSGFLLTGDTLYPGRLYVRDLSAYIDSLDRLVEFTDSRPVTHLMGCHIEMTRTPGRDYPMGERYQPDEPPLQMSVAQLRAARDALRASPDRPGAYPFDDFVVFNGRPVRAIARHAVRSLWSRVRTPRR